MYSAETSKAMYSAGKAYMLAGCVLLGKQRHDLGVVVPSVNRSATGAQRRRGMRREEMRREEMRQDEMR